MARQSLFATALLLVLSPMGSAAGQTAGDAAATYPKELVRLVVPFSAGSMTDILARSLAEKLAARWKQQVIVENRPGLAGTASVAKGPADGLTLMLTSNGHTVIKLVNRAVSFEPVEDFAAVTKVASTPSVLIAPPDAPAGTLRDLISAAKAKPGALNYSSAGLGSATNIAAELLKQATGAEIVHVPHRGMPESQTSVLRADVAMAFTFFNVSGDLIQAGKLKALAVTGDKRLAALPDVPTFTEAGLPQFSYDAWFGILVPAATPKAIIAKVGIDVARALEAPDMKARFEKQGVELVSSTPEAFDAVLREDQERYRKLYPKPPGG